MKDGLKVHAVSLMRGAFRSVLAFGDLEYSDFFWRVRVPNVRLYHRAYFCLEREE